MGSLHNELRRSPISGAVLKALGVEDNEAVLERFGETLQPVFDVWGRIEWDAYRKEFVGTCGIEVAAGGATTLASVALYNNTAKSPNTLIVVDRFEVYVTATATVIGYLSNIAASPTIATNITTRPFVDRRVLDNQAGNEATAQILTGIPVGTPTQWIQADRLKVLANEQKAFRGMVPAVLPPGHFIGAQNTDDAAALGVVLRWRERQVRPGELD